MVLQARAFSKPTDGDASFPGPGCEGGFAGGALPPRATRICPVRMLALRHHSPSSSTRYPYPWISPDTKAEAPRISTYCS